MLPERSPLSMRPTNAGRADFLPLTSTWVSSAYEVTSEDAIAKRLKSFGEGAVEERSERGALENSLYCLVAILRLVFFLQALSVKLTF